MTQPSKLSTPPSTGHLEQQTNILAVCLQEEAQTEAAPQTRLPAETQHRATLTLPDHGCPSLTSSE